MLFLPSIPGKTWIGKGAFWGLHTLLAEPLLLNLLELAILLLGSAVEGMVIALILAR